MSADQSAIKLHDKFTGLRLLARRVGAFPNTVIQFGFDAPRPIPAELIPANVADPRANIDAFQRINAYLQSRIVELD